MRTFVITSRWIFLRMINVSDKSCRENKKILFMWSSPPPKSCCLGDYVERYGRAGQATNDSMTHAHFMLDTQGYKHTLNSCNTRCFSTTTMVATTRLNITLQLHCLYYLFWLYSDCRTVFTEIILVWQTLYLYLALGGWAFIFLTVCPCSYVFVSTVPQIACCFLI